MRVVFYAGVLSGFVAFLLISYIVIESAPPQASYNSNKVSPGISPMYLVNLSESTCQDIESDLLRDDCYFNFAAQEGSASICAYIYDEIKKQMCLAAARREPSLCLEMKLTVSRDQCLQELAYVTDDASPCVHVSNQEEKDWCHYIIAAKVEDISLCSPIKDLRRMEKCRQNVKETLSH